MSISPPSIQKSLNNAPNLLVDPLINYHGKVVEVITFKPLPKNSEISEIVLRIVIFISIPLGYVALGFMALIGTLISSCSSKKVSLQEAADEPAAKSSKPSSNQKKIKTSVASSAILLGKVSSTQITSGATSNVANLSSTHQKTADSLAVANVPSDLRSQLSALYTELLPLCYETRAHAHYAGKGKIKFDKTQTGAIYIETENRDGKPRHFDIFPNGNGLRIDAKYGESDFNKSSRVGILESDLSLINWAVSKIKEDGATKSSVSTATKPLINPVSVFGSDKLSKRILGSTIPANVQESQKHAGYNWKQAYAVKASDPGTQKTLPKMQQFVQQADSAIIAYRGSLSNFQTVAFKDPISGHEMRSAEHMFQMYKFPERDPQKRSVILQQQTPKEALRCAQKSSAILLKFFKSYILQLCAQNDS